jgi:gliding motility-associated-like protein
MSSAGGSGAGYVYSVAPSGTALLNIISGLCAGTIYTITTTDGSGCSGTTTVLLTTPNSPTVSVTSTTLPSCVPGCDGTATVTALGGTTLYGYSITGPGTPLIDASGNATDLCVGTYVVTVTDVNGCQATTTVLLASPSSPTVTTIQTNLLISGGNNGTITATGAGGSGAGYSYSINPDPNAQSPSLTGLFTGLTEQCYTITVTDGNGCTATTTACITAPGLFTISTTWTNLTCFNICNGTITATPNGGVAGFNYSITPLSGTQVGNIFTGLCAGTYTITGNDVNGATDTSIVTITQPTQVLFGTTTSTPAGCNPNNTGTITTTAAGGTGAITYSINPDPNLQSPSATGNFTGLTSQNYVITATDASGCTSTTLVNVGSTGGVTITNTAFTNVTCNGNCNGTITVQTNPNVGITFSIAPAVTPPNSTGLFTALCPDNYVVTATDVNGCTVTAAFTITEPPVLQVLNPSSINVSCFGNNDGTITYVATGGSGPITYTISPIFGVNNNNGTYTGLQPNTYTATATDGNGCIVSSTFAITQQPALVVDSIVVTPTACAGNSNGTATIYTSGGNTGNTYNIGGIPTVSSVFTGLAAGVYVATVTDANNCTTTLGFTIIGATPINIATNVVTSPLCFNDCNGSITVTSSGGTGGLTLALFPGNTPAPFTNLCAGTYSIIATDANGCSNSTTATLINPTPINVSSFATTNPLCANTTNGTASIVDTGGVGPITYSINPNAGVLQLSTGNFTNLAPNTYTITGSNLSGCFDTTIFTITAPTALSWNGFTVNNITCFGANNGSISGNVLGGTGNKNITLNGANPPQVGSFNYTNLLPGAYTVLATDANGCTISTLVNITQPPALLFGAPVVVNNTCFGGNTGSISITASGGSSGYAYLLNPGGIPNTTGVFTGLSTLGGGAGYTVTVTDTNGCAVSSLPIVVTQPTQVIFTSVTKQDILCFGASTGSITVTSTGGTGIKTYTLNPPNTISITGIFNNLFAGNYIVIATDANGCTNTTAVTITQSPPINIAVTFQQPTCFGDMNGSILAIASGGQNPYNYSLNGGALQNNGSFTGLGSANYIITVVDGFACTVSTSVFLPQPLPVSASIKPLSPTCEDSEDGRAIISGSGGNGNYTYYVTPGLRFNKSGVFGDLSAGTYTLIVLDSLNCRYETTFTIFPPANPLNNTFNVRGLSCTYRTALGSASAITVGGLPPYTYTWNTNPVQTTATADSLHYGFYELQTIDAIGCVIKDTIEIEGAACCEIPEIPNAFTPNGDGKNDIFRIYSPADIDVLQFMVENRWGNKVFTSTDVNRGWDGLVNGTKADIGTYYFVFKYRCKFDGKTYIKKGDVTLIK